jgi:hypothetical protein
MRNRVSNFRVDLPSRRFAATIGTMEKDPAAGKAKQVVVASHRADRLLDVDEDAPKRNTRFHRSSGVLELLP